MSTGSRVSRPGSLRTDNMPGRKEAILPAAEKLFAQRGYHAVSIRQIAAEAGVQPALVDERLQRLNQACEGKRLQDRLRCVVQPVLRRHLSGAGAQAGACG